MIDLTEDNRVIFVLDESYSRTIEIGKFDLDDDGYYKFFPNLSRGGYWDMWVLKKIIGFSEQLNEEWDRKLKEELTSHD